LTLQDVASGISRGFDVDRGEALRFGGAKEADVGGAEREVFSDSALDRQCRRQMDRVEGTQGMLLDQVAGESEDLIPEIHANIAFPLVSR
jgi:hypothetical protein